MKFSLNGNKGLSIFDPGYPVSQVVQCANSTPTDVVEETVAASASGLTYDGAADKYSYVWKTDKAWANACRRLTLQFNDGSRRTADFGFTK